MWMGLEVAHGTSSLSSGCALYLLEHSVAHASLRGVCEGGETEGWPWRWESAGGGFL